MCLNTGCFNASSEQERKFLSLIFLSAPFAIAMTIRNFSIIYLFLATFSCLIIIIIIRHSVYSRFDAFVMSSQCEFISMLWSTIGRIHFLCESSTTVCATVRRNIKLISLDCTQWVYWLNNNSICSLIIFSSRDWFFCHAKPESTRDVILSNYIQLRSAPWH